ncbi:hypothetical protein [Desulfogranum japonicum]|uniref:hypothetical protein n=1 Tax=Desulfogranum japonicum TaxID=231447 RepID=UPI000410C94D|nr:hypothetical protein [Desulfogranum japonicum]
MFRISILVTLLMTPIFFSACSFSTKNNYAGIHYPPTENIQTVFQYTQAPDQCRVFAEVLVTIPPETTGDTMANLIKNEARSKGADVLLVGQTRQSKDDDDLEFLYLGPKREYNCKEEWVGWKSGFSKWEDQGEWVNIGYNEWGKSSIRYAEPLIMQIAMLRCH